MGGGGGGRSSGPMGLGELSVLECHIIWIIVGQGPIALAISAGGMFGHFFSTIFSLFFCPLCETAWNRLSQRAVKPKQPTNQPGKCTLKFEILHSFVAG